MRHQVNHPFPPLLRTHSPAAASAFWVADRCGHASEPSTGAPAMDSARQQIIREEATAYDGVRACARRFRRRPRWRNISCG